jgi:hypothetical protein
MSDTPETDHAIRRDLHPFLEFVPADFCRDMERQRDEAINQLVESSKRKGGKRDHPRND